MVKDWKGWDAVNCLNQSVHTQSGCKKWVWAKPNLYPLMTRKQVVVTILEPTHQSQPRITIHYTHNERLDGLSWYEMAGWFSLYTLKLDVKRRGLVSKFHHPRLQSWSVVMVVGDEFQSPPFSNRSLYFWWHVGRVEMLWIAWISQYTLNLGAKSGFVGPSQICTHSWPENRLWWPF